MIDEKTLAELLFRHDKACNEGATYDELAQWAREAADALNILEAALKVVRAGVNIEDLLEIPSRLGLSSQIIIQKAIDDFKEVLSPFKKEIRRRSEEKTGK